MFNQTNFPQATNAQLTNARALYSILVGRVSSVTANARLNKADEYVYLGQGLQQGRLRELGFFVQDNWRWKPNLTVNAGLRYELQRPFYARNNSYATATMADVCGVSGIGSNGGCNLFQPGNLIGQKPTFKAFPKGTYAYKTDWNNVAPTLGMSWVPGGRGGFMGKILGQEGDTVLRAGYSLAYERHGMSDFSDVFGTNPGVSVSANRDTATGTLLQDGLGFPVLLRDRGRLGPPNNIPRTQQYPFTEVITGDLDIFDENLQVPYSQTWTASVGRKITRNIGMDVRYVGARHLQGWIDYNYNEANILENGFLNEFRLAQANLQANVAAGKASDGFKFTGIPGTSPLPIYLAYLVGSRDVNNPAAYTGTGWTNTDWTNPLAIRNPNPFTPAGTNSNTGLDGDPGRRTNAANAGLPANFFRANPDLQGGVFLTGNGGYYRYDSAQIELRTRMSNGFEFQTSYVFGNAYSTIRPSLRTPRYKVLQTGAEGGVTHAWKGNWVWELPFGRNRKFLSNSNGFVERLAGGWEFDGIVRIQSGRMLDFGDVNIVGMSAKDLQKAVGVYTYKIDGLSSSAVDALYLLPKDIIENTVRAFNANAMSLTGYGSLGAPSGRYIAPGNGPTCIAVTPGSGECGVRTLVVTGPLYSRWDLSAVKRVRIVGRTNFEFRAEMLNAFNHPNFVPVISTNTNSDNYRMTSLQENGSRIVQLVWRMNW